MDEENSKFKYGSDQKYMYLMIPISILIIFIILYIAVVSKPTQSSFVGYQVASDVSGDLRAPAFLSNKYANKSGKYNSW